MSEYRPAAKAEYPDTAIGPEYEPRLQVQPLTREYAHKHQARLSELANLIPEVSITPEDILAECKPDGRDTSSKWDYSYALQADDQVVGFVMGYIRAAEGNQQYPVESLYMSELAVDPGYQGQGLARQLIGHYMEQALRSGTKEFTLQTNAAEWNAPVRHLYESCGFVVDGHKQYPNRQDVIMRLHVDTPS